jgi:hypothetical protein
MTRADVLERPESGGPVPGTGFPDEILGFGPDVRDDARQRFPELYLAAVSGRGSLEQILEARQLQQRSAEHPKQDPRPSQYLEARLRHGFEARFGEITNTYWCAHADGGAIVTDRGYLVSSLHSFNEELMTIEVSIKQLARDAQRTFTRDSDLVRRRQAGDEDANRLSLAEISTMLFSALSRVLYAADVLMNPAVCDAEKRAALKSTRTEWRLARHRAEVLIQRQARLEYFYGVLAGAPFAIVSFGVLGLLAAGHWSSALSASSLMAATVCGALGAVVSVTQRMASGRLKIDYTASASSKKLLGAWRPFLGGVLGGVLQFAIIGGLLTVQGREPTPDSPATFAFYALVGFTGGFSERLATDLLERAGQLISPPRAADEPADGAADDDRGTGMPVHTAGAGDPTADQPLGRVTRPSP